MAYCMEKKVITGTYPQVELLQHVAWRGSDGEDNHSGSMLTIYRAIQVHSPLQVVISALFFQHTLFFKNTHMIDL